MNRSSTNRQVFTYLTGQYDNLGDALLRRAMVAQLHELGQWYVYVGDAPADYVASLHLPGHTVIHRSAAVWSVRAAHAVSSREDVIFLANPGEISSTRGEFLLGALSSALMLVGRLAHNPSYRIGIGARDRIRPLSLGHELATKLAAVNVWRDAVSRDMYGGGEIAPDWAFALPGLRSDDAKVRVSISYRGDRPLPPQSTLRSLSQWATDRQLELLVVTQVARDLPTNRKLADDLGVEHIASVRGDLLQVETLVRAAYSTSSIVLSNRIHSLILGAVDGAVPGAILGHPDVKIERTFTAAGIELRPLAGSASADQVRDYLDGLLASARDVDKALGRAREKLRVLGNRLKTRSM